MARKEVWWQILKLRRSYWVKVPGLLDRKALTRLFIIGGIVVGLLLSIVDHGACALRVTVLLLERDRWWLVRPMQEWQSFPHKVRMWLVVGRSPSACAFRLALLSSARSRILSSPIFSCSLSKQRQLLQLVSSLVSVLMSRPFMSRL